MKVQLRRCSCRGIRCCGTGIGRHCHGRVDARRNAADTVAQLLRAMGYSVQINGSVPVPCSECVTTAVHGAPSTADASDQPSGNVPFATVYVDVSGSDDY